MKPTSGVKRLNLLRGPHEMVVTEGAPVNVNLGEDRLLDAVELAHNGHINQLLILVTVQKSKHKQG